MTKTHISRLLPVLVGGLMLLLASPLGAHAQDATPTAIGIDVVIVLDDSGSMATCWPWSDSPRNENCRPAENPPSDPHDLRYSAARLLTQLASDEDRIAIVRFNAETQDLIGRLQPLGARNNRQSLLATVQPPDDYTRTGGYTRIDLGLARAVQILKAAPGPARPRYVILLTDGVPTQEGPRAQDQAIQQAMAEFERLGAQVFPVFLCNDKAGCPDDSFVKRTMGKVPDKAKTAQELLQVFSATFARMKPDLHVVDRRNAAGDIQFTIREAHGAQQLVIVAENGGLVALKRNGNPETISRAFQDPNILMNIIEAGKLAPGTWTMTTKGDSSFVVAQTATVPELVYPPPATPGSAAAPHYMPAGKPALIVARVTGPGAGEPLKLNEATLLEPLAAGDPLRWAMLPGPGELTLQVGEDAGPLQIRRSFRIETRADLPTALTLSPAAGASCLPEEPCPLKAGFGPGAEVTDLQAMVYVRDETQGGKLVYAAPMTCADRECADGAQAFKRESGHTYTVRFLLQGRAGGTLFGDWTESALAIAPAVYLRGLPPVLNLKTQPVGGWPITLVAGAAEDLGQLWATVALTRTDDNTPVADVQVNFSARISGAGEQPATLQITPPPGLRPGIYEGLLSFATDKPATGSKVRLPAAIPVSLNLARPAAQIAAAAVDFGTVIFDTSPNFRVNETVYATATFDEAPFNLKPESLASSCSGLELIAGPPEAHGSSYRLPLTLRSAGPIAPQTCSGTFVLRGPSEDYIVNPAAPLSWRLVIPAVEWKILGVRQGGASAPDANLGNLGRAGERAGATLEVRYTGKPPFSLQLADLSATAEQAGIAVGKDDLDLAAAPVVQQAGADVYHAPIELLVRRSLPQDSWLARWLTGADYSGVLKLQVAGLPTSQTQEVRFRLHNPSLYQRYVQPFYRLLWPGVVTIPLSIVIPLLLLVLMWKRSKDAGVERLMRRSGAHPWTTAPGASGVSPRLLATKRDAGPSRWARPPRAPRPTAATGGQGYRIPQRQAQPTAGKQDTAAAVTSAARAPAPTLLPPPQRRARATRPTPPK